MTSNFWAINLQEILIWAKQNGKLWFWKKKMRLYIKIDKIIIKFSNIEIEKQKFHQRKRPISIKIRNINNTVASNKPSLGKKDFKYFIGYKDAKKFRPLCIFLPRISAYRKAFDETEYKYFFNKRWLEKYNEIWETLETVGKKNW